MDAAGESTYHLAEWYLPELTEQSVDDMVARLDAAATALTGEHAGETSAHTRGARRRSALRGVRRPLNGPGVRQLAAAGDGAVVVAGDFNATRDLREFRRLLRDGYRDAAEQAGAGLTRTHPADIWLPPVFAVDHILTNRCAAIAVRTLPIKGSDHRALLAHVQLPLRDGAARSGRETPDSRAASKRYLRRHGRR